MIKKILLLMILMFNFIILHAQRLSIDGKVTDFEKKPIERATVYLLKLKDSSIVNYTSTNKEGEFLLKIDELDEPTILKIDAEKLNSYSKDFEKIDQSFSLGKIELKNSFFNIEEVKLTASPVKIKKDTIEFNASTIKVRPDSKIEELLRQIPGVEIRNDGKITVNGREVDQIMVNGKAFFDKDGKIALQNLPADIIKNIQITTTKSKEEELSGKTAKSKNKTINFTIDEKKNKGLISRVTLGYGSDKRYEGSGLAIYLKNDTKISLLVSSNNINSQGFSNDEVFDSMGHGRNSWLMQGGIVTTEGNSTYYMQSENNNAGIQKSTTIGFNYSDKLGKNADLESFSMMHSDNNLESRSKVLKTTLLPNYTLVTNSENNGENRIKQYNFDSSVKIKLDSLTSVYISPSFSREEGFSFNNLESSTLRDNILLNENKSYTNKDSEKNSFNPSIFFSKKFKKKGRVIDVIMSSSISESKSSNLNKSQTIFYQSPDTNDNRNQLTENKNQNNAYRFKTRYTEPISDSANVSLGLNYDAKSSRELRDVNDFNENNGQYSDYNTLLSNNMNQRINDISPNLSFEINRKKINIMGEIGVGFTNLEVNSTFNSNNGQQYHLQKNFVLPYYNISVQYNFSENKTFSLYSFSDLINPSAGQLSPYTDLSNPLISFKGNPELESTWKNRTDLYFNNSNLVKNISYFLNIGFTYSNNDIINDSYYGESGKQFANYVNVSGNKYFYLGGGFSKTFKWKKHKFTINPIFNINYDYKKGFVSGQQYSSNLYSFNPGLNLTYEIKDKITVKPSFKLQYNISNYTNYSIDKINTTNKILKVELTNYLFQGKLVFGNDFEYNTTSNIAPGFKNDFYFWNTSLGYSFFNKQLTAKIKIYDVLNQNQSIKRVILDSYFEDREDLILKRYIMFSLTMKLNKFAGKKLQEEQ